MNVSVESSAKICWLLAVAIAAAGYFAIVSPAELHIAEIGSQADVLLARVLADERAVKDADRLEGLQHEIGVELAGINLGTDRSGIIAEFLRDLQARAVAHRVRLLSVQNELAAAGARSARAAASDPFEAAAIDVVLQGRYAAVLQMIADLSHSRVLMKIEQSSLDRARGVQDEDAPVLSTQLKLVVFYLRASPLTDGHATRAT